MKLKNMKPKDKLLCLREIGNVIALSFFVVGLFIMGFAAMKIGAFQELINDEYMTNPAMPYNEYENATYTYSAKWLADEVTKSVLWIIPGMICIAVGYAVLLSGDLFLSKKMLHKSFCKKVYDKSQTYCGDCGIKLSLTKKKKRD